MAIGPEQGQLMQLLARAIGARRYLEIGVFTGYSSLAMALALPADGYVLACDVNEENTAVARRYWRRRGWRRRSTCASARRWRRLHGCARRAAKPFDMAFIDADKVNVGEYYERALELVRPGGLVLVDNVLWDGAVVDRRDRDPIPTRCERSCNGRARRTRDAALLPICDGLLVALKALTSGRSQVVEARPRAALGPGLRGRRGGGATELSATSKQMRRCG